MSVSFTVTAKLMIVMFLIFFLFNFFLPGDLEPQWEDLNATLIDSFGKAWKDIESSQANSQNLIFQEGHFGFVESIFFQ